MNFTKEICPACKKLTTQVFDTDNYICMDENHYYIVDEETGNWFKLAFKGFYIKDYLTHNTDGHSYLRDNKGVFLPQGIQVDLRTISNLPSIDEIIDYLHNLVIMQ